MFGGCIGGKWTFLNTATKATTVIDVGQDSSPGKVKKAFDAAKIILSPASDDYLMGTDPRGNSFRYTSASMGKKFNR